jgi:hypothetical protein
MKKQSKKAAPKKSAKKTAVKAAPKKAANKKAAVKKVVKKATAKKVAPKAGKKAAKKAQGRAKKMQKKIVTTTTTVVTTTTTTTKQLNPKETHYLLVLDESGSMDSVRQQTLDGLNEQIQAINKLEAQYPDHKYFINILKFDNDFRDLIIDTPVSKVRKFTSDDYKPNASTALRDAIGFGVTRLNQKIEGKIASGDAKALVIILTDGEENASLKYSPEEIKGMITKLDATQLWTFTFIGANQDSVTTANSYGIHASNVANYRSSTKGTSTAFAAVTAGMSNVASGYNLSFGGGYSNKGFMTSVLHDSNNIGEDASKLNVGTVNTAAGNSGSIANSAVPTSTIKSTTTGAIASEQDADDKSSI